MGQRELPFEPLGHNSCRQGDLLQSRKALSVRPLCTWGADLQKGSRSAWCLRAEGCPPKRLACGVPTVVGAYLLLDFKVLFPHKERSAKHLVPSHFSTCA